MTILTKDSYLKQILDFVKEKRSLDFSQYRVNLLSRRVMARVRLTRRDNFEQYLAYLKSHVSELDNLMETLTINVTEFFRDSHVFDAIEKKVIPEIFTKKQNAKSKMINIWSCGCSSGEEAYSLLMLMAEYLDKKLDWYQLKILGTDIDNQILAKAREGVYEARQFKNLSSDKKFLMKKYFYQVDHNRYWIREDWSSYLDFRYHDVMADAPFERMDMILCRNLFIYFDRALQDQVLDYFWRALREGGFLILGAVESMMGEQKEKFTEYDRSARIFIKK